MKNAIIRTFAIVALLGFGSEMKAVRSSEAFYFSNDSISPDENIGQLSEREDSIRKSMEEAVIYKLKDTLDLWNLSRSPYISVPVSYTHLSECPLETRSEDVEK